MTTMTTRQTPHIHIYNNTARVGVGYLISLFVLLFALQIGVSLLSKGLLALVTFPEGIEMLLHQIAASSSMLIAPLLCEMYQRRRKGAYVFRDLPHVGGSRGAVLALLLYASAYVVMVYAGYIGEEMGYPEWLGKLGELLKMMEANIDSVFLKMLAGTGIFGKLLVLIAMAVMAPVGEELIFRGAMQGWIYNRTGRIHVAIIAVAIVFSAIHMQFSGFLPRFVMGVALGYIAAYGSLRLAILAHALNNLIAVVIFYATGVVNKAPGEMTEYATYMGVAALVALIFGIIIVRRMRALR